ncbi:DUF6049 family protein [Microbacterium sp. 18062]|uniref:DUF6049 family protein n=1 Tax=Microbacterium sp. 18062 TaxID=2681410 RepID=UPI00135A6E38|nr:DUF6049 family protein [Microbacterium sp. 18062]
MIPTSAHAGITATRRRSRILAAMAVLLIALGISAPARAATPSPTPTLSGETTLTVGALGNGVLTPGESLTTIFSLQNDTSARVAGGEATLHLADGSLGSRDDLAAWLDGSRGADAGRAIGATVIDAAASGESTSGGVQVAAEDEALQNRAPGIYPIWLTLGELEARSVVVVPGSAAGSIGVVVPITAGPLQRGLLTSDSLETMTAPDGSLTAALDAVEGTPAILAIDPAVPAAIRVLGTAAPESAQEWLARMLQLPNSRFALQFGDADVATQIDAGLAEPLQPTSLAAYIDAANIEPDATPSPTPSGSADAEDADAEGADTGPELPDLESLLDIGDPDAPIVYWPPSGIAGPQVVSALSATAEGALTLVSSSTLASDADGTSTARATVTGAPVLVSDARITAALHDASIAADSAARAGDLAAASAGITLASAEAGGAPVLVSVDRGADRTRLGLHAAIAAATTVPGVAAASLGDLSAAAATDATLAAVSSDPTRTGAVGVLNAGADSIARFATVLDDPALLTGPERAGILQLLGAAWVDDPSAWLAAYAAHQSATDTTLSSVTILPSSALNLLTAGTNLRFWVHNELPYPVNVVLYAVPDDLRLEVDRETVVTGAAPSSNTPVEVPVRARIGNGDVQIDLSLRSPTLEPIGVDQTVDVNVRADWEGIGLILMIVLVTGFFVIGVVRTVRRRRRVGAGDETDGGNHDDPTADAETDAASRADEVTDAAPSDPDAELAGDPVADSVGDDAPTRAEGPTAPGPEDRP